MKRRDSTADRGTVPAKPRASAPFSESQSLGCFLAGSVVCVVLILAAEVGNPAMLGNQLMILLFLIALGLLLFALNRILDPWLSKVFARSADSQKQQLAEAWAALAKRTGLTFHRGGTALPVFGMAEKAAIGGRYRGRPILIRLAVFGDAEHNPPGVYTVIVLKVRNLGGQALSIREKHAATKGFVRSGRKPFDRWFRVKGNPETLVDRAVELVVQRPSIMLGEAPKLIMKTHPDRTGFLTTEWRRPEIEWTGPSLICHQHGILVDVDEQIGLLNLLCELADLGG